ncbi:MAG TPA: SURF1 family protein [Burkholderiales bacterium]|nr:SURF1 family protein [Burkholderiales bacterium]
MKLAGYAFRPRWWGLALALAGCAAGVALGNWQWQRAEERREALAALKPIEARGSFVPQYTVLLDFRVHRGRPGYHVVQPLRKSDGRHVLVVRGWIAADPRRERLPDIRTPAGEQRIAGIARERLPQYLSAAAPPSDCRPGPRPCVWQNLTLEAFAAWSGLALERLLIEQSNDSPDGLARDWEHPEAAFRKNEMYALQWYSLAALSVVLFLVLSIRREKHPSR